MCYLFGVDIPPLARITWVFEKSGRKKTNIVSVLMPVHISKTETETLFVQSFPIVHVRHDGWRCSLGAATRREYEQPEKEKLKMKNLFNEKIRPRYLKSPEAPLNISSQ